MSDECTVISVSHARRGATRSGGNKDECGKAPQYHEGGFLLGTAHRMAGYRQHYMRDDSVQPNCTISMVSPALYLKVAKRG